MEELQKLPKRLYEDIVISLHGELARQTPVSRCFAGCCTCAGLIA